MYKGVIWMLVIDLFCGAGGLHIGFEKAGFEVGLCIDNNDLVEQTHRYNFPNIPFINQDISTVTSERIREIVGNREIDVLIGGPPCQGFSTIGNRVSSDPKIRFKQDPRNRLVFEYIRMIEELNPKVFVIENVKGLLTMGGGKFIETVVEEIEKLGKYEVKYKLVNMANYGVPQVRERVIIIGSRLEKEVTFPKIEYFEEECLLGKKWVPCWDVLQDLANIEEDRDFNHVPLKHTAKNIERYKYIPEGGRLPENELPPELYRKNFGNTFKRLDRNKPALTMVPGNDAFPIHPILNRSLTVREAARIQTFPDDIIFRGNRRQQGHQVGNAVPPLFAEKLAKHIKDNIL